MGLRAAWQGSELPYPSTPDVERDGTGLVESTATLDVENDHLGLSLFKASFPGKSTRLSGRK